jgi:hypothetical protein
MTDRATLTACYLDELARHGATGGDMLGVFPRNGLLAQRRYLSRPLFIGHAESSQLNADLQHIRQALVSLPGRIFGGDLASFARAHRLHYADTMATEISMIFDETGLGRDSCPMVALVDWPHHFKIIKGSMRRIAERWCRRCRLWRDIRPRLPANSGMEVTRVGSGLLCGGALVAGATRLP